MDQISEMWAKALLDVALEDNKGEKIKDEISLITPFFDDALMKFLKAPKITKEEKKEIVKYFDIDQILKNFISLVIDKDRSAHILAIFEGYEHLYNEHYGIKEVRLISARAIDEDQKDRLIAALKKRYGSVVVKEEIDERLLSGIKLIVEDKVIDVSMQKKIRDLRRTLLESW